ncbi:MAG: aldehyde dehydrogenase family protein [Planctomycetota bacterium]
MRKTYKLYVGGKFPRSESGRVYQPAGNTAGNTAGNPAGNPGCNTARASRKDLRDAVLAARKGLASWSGASAYLRGQILYRIAEMLTSRRDAMVAELQLGGETAAAASKEVDAAISLTTWYAGLCDKIQSLLGSQNAVNGPFFNFSTVEPTGVIGVIAPEQPALSGLLAMVLPVLAAGNAAIVLASERAPFAALALGEVMASSDVPAGACNVLAGSHEELGPHFAAHRDLDGMFCAGAPNAEWSALAADNVKRVRYLDLAELAWKQTENLQSLAYVEPFVEVKTLWHPVAP